MPTNGICIGRCDQPLAKQLVKISRIGAKIHVGYDHDGIQGITAPHDKMLEILDFEVKLSPIQLGQSR